MANASAKAFIQAFGWLPTGLLGFALFAVPLQLAAQGEHTAEIVISGSDVAAGSAFSNFQHHILPANTEVGKAAVALHGFGAAPADQPAAAPSPLSQVPSPGFYPDDLVFFGGHVVPTLKNHNIYVNCADQYVGASADDRYPVGASVSTKFALFTSTIGETDLRAIVHAAAKDQGSGYGHIYHVFLPKGIDTCFDLTSICYSPDNPPSFVFCAYHGSVDFADIGHVLFSVEPFQNVGGCQAAAPNPNGILADSTNSVLSHELIESITDPDPGSGWVAAKSLLASGAEIGDLCVPVGNKKAQFLDLVFALNGNDYELQLEYSNKFHACANVP